MKFNIGDHLQEIDSVNGYVVESFRDESPSADGCAGAQRRPSTKSSTNWYLLENDELGLVNHWVPESKLELHKQPLRDKKLNELGI